MRRLLRGRGRYAAGGAAALLLVAVALLLGSCSSAKPGALKAAKPSTAKAGVADTYAGVESCRECHAKSFESIAPTKMGRILIGHPGIQGEESRGCETCHGPSKQHVTTGGKIVGGLITFSKGSTTPISERNQVCLTCHTKGNRVFWEGSAHEASDTACTHCHTVMKDVSRRDQLAKGTVIDTCATCHLREVAKQLRNSHMPLREGKMTCTSCHNPHGTVTPALLKENSLNDTCYTCHTEKRGPFLWEHPPVLESCSNCHDPHGSNHERMLKLAKPRLCQQCHNEQRIHPSSPYGRGTETLTGASPKFVFGRSCSNCHPTIHGSNHPSGAGFIR